MRIICPILLGMLIGNFLVRQYSSHVSIDDVQQKRIVFQLGKVYKICPPKREDPYFKKEWHNVIISDTSGYYVQYYEVGKKEPRFSRSCSEFQELINNCK
jgi:hypothetical protein